MPLSLGLPLVTVVSLWALLVEGGTEGKSETSRVKLKFNDKQLCLSLRSRFCDPSDVGNGRCVLALPCDTIQQVAQNVSDDIVDLWRLDSNGLLVSHASGHCLSSSSDALYSNCTADDGWRLSDGKLESLQQKGCLSPQAATPDEVAGGYSLEVMDCGRAVSWQMEKSSLVVYPIPAKDWKDAASPKYKVSVAQGSSKPIECYVYYTTPGKGDPMEGQSTSYVTFSFEGVVKVSVTKLTGGQFNSVVVRPLSLDIEAAPQSGSTTVFTVSKTNSKISVEFDQDWQTDQLLIFADPLETDIPPMFNGPEDDDITVYGPGPHYINAYLKSNAKVYIHGGAFLFAKNTLLPIIRTSDDSSLEKISIRGRGVLSGKTSMLGIFTFTICGSNHYVEGITIVDAPQQSHFQINAPWSCNGGWTGKAGGARVDNVKLLGWKFADGLYAGARSHVSNVFTKVNDDGVKPFESDTLFEKLTLWQQQNGWPIMLSWLSNGPQSNITVRDATIMHDGHFSDWSVSGCDPCRPSQASIGAVHGGSSTIKDVLVENVVMESRVWRPVWFGIEKSQWAHEGTGTIEGWTLRNIQVRGGSHKNSEVVGGKQASQMSNIKFEDYEFEGHRATGFNDAHMDVVGATQHVEVTQSGPKPTPAPTPKPAPTPAPKPAPTPPPKPAPTPPPKPAPTPPPKPSPTPPPTPPPPPPPPGPPGPHPQPPPPPPRPTPPPPPAPTPPPPTPPAPPPPIPACVGDAGLFRLKQNPKKCMDIANGDLHNGAKVQIYDCMGWDQQNFKWCEDGRIVSTMDEKMCLDVPGGDPSVSRDLWMWECDGAAGQYWMYDPRGLAIYPYKTGKDMCMDTDNGSEKNGAGINIYSCLMPFTSQMWITGKGPIPTPSPDKCIGKPGRFVVNRNQNMCIDINLPKGELFNGATVQIWKCNGQGNQDFKWCSDGRIVSSMDETMCLDVPGGDPSKPYNLQMWKCTKAGGQYWQYDYDDMLVYPAALGAESNRGHKMCMDINGGTPTPGSRVLIYNCEKGGEPWYTPADTGANQLPPKRKETVGFTYV